MIANWAKLENHIERVASVLTEFLCLHRVSENF